MMLATVARGRLFIVLSSLSQSGLTEEGNKSEFLNFFLGISLVLGISDPPSFDFLFFG